MDEFEQITNLYRNGHTIADISKQCNISEQKTRKVLITTGDLVTKMSEECIKLHNEGLLISQIAEQLNLSISAVNSNIPYKKGIYMSSKPSKNALNIRKSRVKTNDINSDTLNDTAISGTNQNTNNTTLHEDSLSHTKMSVGKKKYKNVMVHVWGKQAVFQRAEIKHDVCSYSIITPSAAKGIIERIYWHPGMMWIIDNIYVINPIRFMPDNVTLKDVDYIIEAHFEMTKEAGPRDNAGKFKDIFLRRLNRQETFKPIYLGSENYPAQFEAFQGDINRINSYYRKTIKDLGILFYDFDYDSADEPMFFHAILKYGVLSLKNIKILK